MICDGIDPENPRFDPSDSYVSAAIADSVRAGLVVYTIYWQNRSIGANSNDGQSLMSEVTQATGGNDYWMGMGNPVRSSLFLTIWRDGLTTNTNLTSPRGWIASPQSKASSSR